MVQNFQKEIIRDFRGPIDSIFSDSIKSIEIEVKNSFDFVVLVDKKLEEVCFNKFLPELIKCDEKYKLVKVQNIENTTDPEAKSNASSKFYNRVKIN
jgi:hypothetical protein